MTRFFGVVGYGIPAETPPGSGVWVDTVVEYPYKGDVLKVSRNLVPGEKLNNDITVSNSISILADQYAVEHFAYIKYVKWAGVLWTVSSVQVQSPRLILSLGSVYNGPTV